MKQIRLHTNRPITIDPAIFLNTINSLRNEYGEKKKDKAPIALPKALESINLFSKQTADKGMLSFNLSYEDENGIPCVRNFPNFGLDVKSNSKLEEIDNKLLLSIDITVKAGKPKWQVDEITDCGKIFINDGFNLELNITLDETTDWGGHSAALEIVEATPDSRGLSIPASQLIIETI